MELPPHFTPCTISTVFTHSLYCPLALHSLPNRSTPQRPHSSHCPFLPAFSTPSTISTYSSPVTLSTSCTSSIFFTAPRFSSLHAICLVHKFYKLHIIHTLQSFQFCLWSQLSLSLCLQSLAPNMLVTLTLSANELRSSHGCNLYKIYSTYPTFLTILKDLKSFHNSVKFVPRTVSLFRKGVQDFQKNRIFKEFFTDSC